MKTLQFDSEFKNSRNPFVTPLCAVVRIEGVDHRFWFPEDTDRFKGLWLKWMDQGLTIVSYFCSAEARFLLALGFTAQQIVSWTWADPFVMWKMLTFSRKYKYGRQIQISKSGEIVWVTTTPPLSKEDEESWDEDDDGVMHKHAGNSAHKAVGYGLLDAVANRLGIDGNAIRKDQMRKVILETEALSPEQRQSVLDYCASDVAFLLDLLKDLYRELHTVTSGKFTLTNLQDLSLYTACCGIMENYGIPFAVGKARHLGANYREIDNALIEACNEHYPFYTKRKATKKERTEGAGATVWAETDAALDNFVNAKGLADTWPKSTTGKFQRTKEVLKDFSGDPYIDAYHHTRTARQQIKYFRPAGISKIMGNVGPDGHIRILLSPYGSKTGRNQPSVAQGFIYGMSTWFRPLIEDATDSIVGADFSAEEIALQGYVSGDENFLKSYQDGDPYAWFSRYTGVMQANAIKKGDIFVDEDSGQPLSAEEQALCKGIRNTFKALVLGVGYGMGLDKLATRLTAARVKNLTKDEQNILRSALINPADPALAAQAEEIMSDVRVYGKDALRSLPDSQKAFTYKNYHTTTFSEYWRWRESTISQYRSNGYLMLPDGWCLIEDDKTTENTVANFPVQGLGTTLLRKAVVSCIRAGLRPFAPLHDCIYLLSSKGSEERDKQLLVDCMRKAVVDICGYDLIRIDAKIHHTDWDKLASTYTEDKGKYELKNFGGYMLKSELSDLPPVVSAPAVTCVDEASLFPDKPAPTVSGNPLFNLLSKDIAESKVTLGSVLDEPVSLADSLKVPRSAIDVDKFLEQYLKPNTRSPQQVAEVHDDMDEEFFRKMDRD